MLLPHPGKVDSRRTDRKTIRRTQVGVQARTIGHRLYDPKSGYYLSKISEEKGTGVFFGELVSLCFSFCDVTSSSPANDDAKTEAR